MKYLIKIFLWTGLLFSSAINSLEFNALEKINSSFHEFSPSISPDGKFMLFNSKRDNDEYMDIYISYFKNGIWSAPVKFDILNSKYNDETTFISRDGTIIVFSSDRDGSHELRLSKNKKIISYDLYWSHKVKGKWTVPELVPGSVNSPDHERAPALSNDNQILYFSRWPSGKMENAFIMSSKLKNDRFDEPVVMPREINSGNMEVALIPDQTNSGFYFSSQRDGGYGGWDIYYISNRNGQLGMPINLGEKINSKYNEAFFSILNGRIYYCSNRPSEGKDYDILEGFLPGQRELVFNVTDLQNFPIETLVEIHNIFEKKMPEIIKKETNDLGSLTIPIEDELESMDIFIEKPGYLPFYRKIDKLEILNPQFDFTLTPIQKEASFSIESIYFDYEKADIKPESLPYLDRLSKYLKNNSALKIQIIGHTDLHGTDDYNLELSKNRANAVQKYLENTGIDSSRLNSYGAGKSEPVINEISVQADKLNRRTQFKIVE